MVVQLLIKSKSLETLPHLKYGGEIDTLKKKSNSWEILSHLKHGGEIDTLKKTVIVKKYCHI